MQPIASEKVSSNVAAAVRGKARYTVTLTEANVERAKKRESNFSGLLYRLKHFGASNKMPLR